MQNTLKVFYFVDYEICRILKVFLAGICVNAGYTLGVHVYPIRYMQETLKVFLKGIMINAGYISKLLVDLSYRALYSVDTYT